MKADHLFLLEVVGFGGIVLAFAFWELYALHRDKKKSRAKEAPGSSKPSTPSTRDAGHAEGQERAHPPSAETVER